MDPRNPNRPGAAPKQGYDPTKPYRQQRQSTDTPQPAARPSQKAAIDQLERDFRDLQIEFERFFNGAVVIPPETRRQQLQDSLRRVRNSPFLTSADSFRLGTFEARFNSYNELFNRRLRDREEGRRGPAARPVEAERSPHDVRQGVAIGEAPDAAAVEALYTGLAKSGRPPKFDLDSFGTYLAHQAAAIRQKTGCAEVQFRLEDDDDGSVRLKARPIRSNP